MLDPLAPVLGHVLPGGGHVYRRAGITGYPLSAADLKVAMGGYGTWDAGWLFDEASGNAVAAFGAPALVPSGTPTQGIDGPFPGAGDKAIRLADNTTQCLSGGDVFDIDLTGDLVVAWVGRHPTAPGATRIFLSKRGVATSYWSLQMSSGAGGTISGVCTDSVNSVIPGAAAAGHVTNQWYVGIMVWERGAVNQARVATNLVTGAAASPAPGALLTCDNTAGFGPGRPGSATAPFDCAALFIGTGLNKAAGCVANIATMVSSFKAFIGLP